MGVEPTARTRNRPAETSAVQVATLMNAESADLVLYPGQLGDELSHRLLHEEQVPGLTAVKPAPMALADDRPGAPEARRF